MSVAKLQYGDRFGDDVKKISRTALSASSSSDAALPSAKYTRWFHGEAGEPEPMATSAKKFRRLAADMVLSEVIAVTKENLSILGDDANHLFASSLPTGHRMRKAIRASILQSVPHLGACKFGEVVTEHGPNAIAVTQMFIANFDGEINTSAGGTDLYKPRSQDFDQMFFGLHVLLDRNGNFLGFNHRLGENGLAFQTKNISTALYNVASTTTGLSLEALRKRAAINRVVNR